MLELETMSYEARDGVAHLRLTNPARANAISPTFTTELCRVMTEIEFDDAVKVVSLTAEGPIFCAGGDVKLFHTLGKALPSTAAGMVAELNTALVKMNALPKPFIGGVRGTVGGGGLSLVGALDLVVAGASTRFTLAYTRAGLSPDGTASYFIARHIGLRRMMDLTLTNRVLSAAEAEAWGLVNRVVADDDVDAATATLADELASGATRALGAAKQVVYNGYEHGIADAAAFEGGVITGLMTGHDAREGIAAFVERRSPRFEGK